jgi:hypothetical protein
VNVEPALSGGRRAKLGSVASRHSSGCTLVIDAPATYDAERRYALQVLLGDRLGLQWQLRTSQTPDVRITVKGDESAGQVAIPDVLFATERRRWLTPASLPPRPLAWRPVPTAEGGDRLPVLYGPRPVPPALLWDEGAMVHVGVDVFGSAFFMLTRYEEVAVPRRDTYDRFPASASLADAEGFLAVPIVDAYVELLWAALRRRWPSLERSPSTFRLSLTHDVDRPLSFLGRGVKGMARQLAGDALLRRDAALMVKRVRSWARVPRHDYALDPDNTFDFLMAVSERHGLASAFYFLATEKVSFIDGYYTLDHPWIRGLLATMHLRGHEIGFHGGFHTYRDPARTKAEFDRLQAAAQASGVQQDRWGGRQHYLRWQNPDTWANWEHAGLDYDSTVGFAERPGFRAGTSHEFRPFHLHERRTLSLCERPLTLMDVTVLDAMRLDPDAAAGTVLDLARRCRHYGGCLTLLWHNSRVQTTRERRWYEALIDSIMATP